MVGTDVLVITLGPLPAIVPADQLKLPLTRSVPAPSIFEPAAVRLTFGQVTSTPLSRRSVPPALSVPLSVALPVSSSVPVSVVVPETEAVAGRATMPLPLTVTPAKLPPWLNASVPELACKVEPLFEVTGTAMPLVPTPALFFTVPVLFTICGAPLTVERSASVWKSTVPLFVTVMLPESPQPKPLEGKLILPPLLTVVLSAIDEALSVPRQFRMPLPLIVIVPLPEIAPP